MTKVNFFLPLIKLKLPLKHFNSLMGQGDRGTTRLGGGQEVPKGSKRIAAYGTVVLEEDKAEFKRQKIAASHVEALEKLMDELNQELQPLEDFILPGGTQVMAFFVAFAGGQKGLR